MQNSVVVLQDSWFGIQGMPNLSKVRIQTCPVAVRNSRTCLVAVQEDKSFLKKASCFSQESVFLLFTKVNPFSGTSCAFRPFGHNLCIPPAGRLTCVNAQIIQKEIHLLTRTQVCLRNIDVSKNVNLIKKSIQTCPDLSWNPGPVQWLSMGPGLLQWLSRKTSPS